MLRIVDDLLIRAVVQGTEASQRSREGSLGVNFSQVTKDNIDDDRSPSLTTPANTWKRRAPRTFTTSTAVGLPPIERPKHLVEPRPKTPRIEPGPPPKATFIPRLRQDPDETLFLSPQEYYLPFNERPQHSKIQLLHWTYSRSSTVKPGSKKMLFDWGSGMNGGELKGSKAPKALGFMPGVSIVVWAPITVELGPGTIGSKKTCGIG
ncbi:BQ2448_1984 [Microbotryum intermedium]|uniref:BQ2448_1984 protein n=1 Tax=Microbotryum intermedium TaxID=269621 RepID=A0A238FAQ4_9BASI|nr:BQ2448_1984 [Microbotryum intermedium]